MQGAAGTKSEPTLNELAKYSMGFLLNFPKPSPQKLLEGLLDHFFSPHAMRRYIEEDVCWFLKQLNTTDMFQSQFSSQSSSMRCLKFYLSRILTTRHPSESPDSMNPLGIFDDQVGAL